MLRMLRTACLAEMLRMDCLSKDVIQARLAGPDVFFMIRAK
jgi:hypothetical protein